MDLDFARNPEVYSRICDLLADGVFTVDAAGTFVAWSGGAERITGYTAEEVVGKPCTLLEGPNCKGFATLKELLGDPQPCAVGGICNQECKLYSKDGREIFIHGNVRLVLDDDGEVAGAVGSFSDVSYLVRANERIAVLERQASERTHLGRLIGQSEPMREVFRRISLAAHSDVTVLITGESGTGKELAAHAIHTESRRASKPFLAVNCSAISESLLESELFGHVKGAFTGADKDTQGLFHAADGGTLFLDEIGEISAALQVKLLRAIQEREVIRVGDHKPRKVDVRFVVATNRDLGAMVAEGKFREDFYYRINVFGIRMPALRERKSDIPLLVEEFVDQRCRAEGKLVSGVARDAMEQMMSYDWPGNVRQLRNAIEHSFVTVSGDTIGLFDLPAEVRQVRLEAACGVADRESSRKTRVANGLTRAEEQDRAKLIRALEETNGNRAAAARLLGVSRVTVWKKIKKYQLAKSPEESDAS